MEKIYIVTNRYGVELGEPAIFLNEDDAKKYVLKSVYENVTEEVIDEIEEEGIDPSDMNEVLEWAEANDYCASYNSDQIDTCTIGDDWFEFKISERDLTKIHR